MLQSIRDNITGWIAWVVVILLSIPFALFGINTYFEGRFTNAVATVNGEEIPNQRFRDRYQNQFQQLRQMFGDQFDPEMIDESRLRRQVLDQMIQEELLIQRAEDQRFRADEREVIEQIRSIQAFHVDGEFSMERYRTLLRAQNMTPSQLEQNLTRELKGQYLQSAVSRSTFVTDQEIERMARLEAQRRIFDEISIAPADFIDRVDVSDDEVEEWYETHADRYMTAEQVDLRYIKLSMAEVRERIEIGEEELREAWERDRERYLEDEERYARHILIRMDDDESAAREKIESLRQRLADGESFEDLAREYSDDTLSGEEGGSLGWVLPGDMVDAVDEVIFTLEAGEVSEVVESEFGLHLVRVDEIETPEPLPFEEARDELLADLRQTEAERRFFDLRETMADEAFTNPDALEPIADILDLDIRTVEDVTRDEGEGIAGHSRVRQEAFSAMVLDEALNSDPIELDDDTVVVLRVVDHRPAEQRPLEAVADQIREEVRQDKATREARALAERLRERAGEGESFLDLAEEADLPIREARNVSRDEPDMDRMLSQALFRMPRPENGPVTEIIEKQDGSLALVALRSVESPTLDMDADERHDRRNAVRSSLMQAEFNAYVRELRRNSDVEVLLDDEEEERRLQEDRI
ncbi:SurA N-terminal domain-containing protein [Gammaproteobacteria bacterium AB-CW1]|uniref:Periplasmic chaperone PpiD n=1 Tax=Natronospira elongata TaxID=3110268 RepID=A0AAP6MKQ8_9GAMM|nr:SurA N-terminal domain-containing protein [Gammaproteobacteria bacterium AB-CW1]